jgi:CHASE2 domain-containing sensor protein
LKKLAVTFSLSLIVVVAIDLSNFENPVTYLTNDFYIKGYQYSRKLYTTDDKIVIVNIADFPTDIIKDQIDILSKYNPAVIGVDYFVPDTAKCSQLINYENLVLPIIVAEDSAQVSKNCFTKRASYGHVGVLSSSFFQPFLTIDGERYASLPTQVIQAYDSTLYNKLLKRKNDKEIINYLGNIQNFTYLGDLTNLPSIEVLATVRNKIVLIGYTGIEAPRPTEKDTYDAYSTPQGKMFGVVLLANILHTALSNYIDPLSQTWSLTILFIVVFLNTLSVRHFTKITRGYLIIKVVQIVQVVLLFVLVSFVIHRFQISVDYESFVFSVIVAPEIAFWSFKNY